VEQKILRYRFRRVSFLYRGSFILWVNTNAVKPVDFHAFIDAEKTFGISWAIINEPSPECIK